MRHYHIYGPTSALGRKAIALLCALFALLLASDMSAASGVEQSYPSLALGTLNSCADRILTIKQLYGCSKVPANQQDITLAQEARDDLNAVLKSDQFRQAILNEHFDSPQMIRNCKGPGCNVILTKQQLYDLLVTTSPKQITVTFYDYLLPITAGNQGAEDSRAWDTVFGNRKIINGNRGFLASLMLHELMHLLGFQHLDESHTCSSVPYSMNRIYGNVAAQLNQTTPGPRNPCPTSGPYR